MKTTIKIGTRGSALALKQVDLVKEALQKKAPDVKVEVVEILTSGDWKPEHGEKRLSETKGGKGQFAKEIEQALLRGDIDCAVHSVKDMDSHPTPGLIMNHYLPREDPRDAFISKKYGSLEEMPEGSVIGTSSVRRAAITLSIRPDLKIVPLRGNVPTRLEKLTKGQVDATFLAVAGLNRLGLEEHITKIMETDEMLPGAGQGAIAIQICEDRDDLIPIFDKINCSRTRRDVSEERAALAVLDGSCHTPIGAYAMSHEEEFSLSVAVFSMDGTETWKDSVCVLNSEAENMGTEVGMRLKEKIPKNVLAA